METAQACQVYIGHVTSANTDHLSIEEGDAVHATQFSGTHTSPASGVEQKYHMAVLDLKAQVPYWYTSARDGPSHENITLTLGASVYARESGGIDLRLEVSS